MSYSTFKKYLEDGNFTLCTSQEEFNLQKQILGLKTKIIFSCKNGHEMNLTLSSLKNKKHRLKNMYEQFCFRCKRSNVREISPTNIPFENSGILPCVESCNVESIDTTRDETGVYYNTPNIPEWLVNYELIVPELYNYYIEKRSSLFYEYVKAGTLVFDTDPYIYLVQKWFNDNINLFTRTRIDTSDIYYTEECVRVKSIPTLKIFVQTVCIYNIDPCKIFSMYANKSHGSPYMIFIYNNDELVDVWYFIPGKKWYSTTHKHNYDFKAKICGYTSCDEADYYYFEKTIFELEIINDKRYDFICNEISAT